MLLETSVDEKTGSEFRRRSGAFSGRSRPHLQTFPSDLDGVVCRRNRAMQGDADGKRRSRDDLNLDQLKREELEIKVKYNKFVYPEEQTAAFYAECRSSVGNRSLPWCFGKNLSRQQGTLKLMGKPNGKYLIRERDPDDPLEPHHRHTLMFVIKHGVSNVKIFSDPDGSVYAENFSDIRKKFRDLKELVAWHKTHTIKHFSVSGGIGDICLTQPIID